MAGNGANAFHPISLRFLVCLKIELTLGSSQKRIILVAGILTSSMICCRLRDMRLFEQEPPILFITQVKIDTVLVLVCHRYAEGQRLSHP